MFQNELLIASFILSLIILAYIVTTGTSRFSKIAMTYTTNNLPNKCLQVNSMLENEEIDANEAKNKIFLLHKEQKIYNSIHKLMYYFKKLGQYITILILVLLMFKLTSHADIQDLLKWVSTVDDVLLSIFAAMLLLLITCSLVIGYLLTKNFEKK